MGQPAARLVLAAPFAILWIVGSLGLLRAIFKEPEADRPFIVFGLTMGIGAFGAIVLLT